MPVGLYQSVQDVLLQSDPERKCDLRELDAARTFRLLVDQYLNGKLRGPFNWPTRLEAGFEASELSALEQTLS